MKITTKTIVMAAVTGAISGLIYSFILEPIIKGQAEKVVDKVIKE